MKDAFGNHGKFCLKFYIMKCLSKSEDNDKIPLSVSKDEKTDRHAYFKLAIAIAVLGLLAGLVIITIITLHVGESINFRKEITFIIVGKLISKSLLRSAFRLAICL